MRRIGGSNTGGICGRILCSAAKRQVAEDLDRSAMVFAPHPDDETLGCGGTIIKKTEQGATVHVVFITSGGQSHVQHMTPEEMIPIRQAEGLAACQALGLKGTGVHFLGLRDGYLAQQIDEGTEAVRRLLRHHRPEEVFVTCGKEPSDDHCAANAIVRRAILLENQSTIVWEYPIWWWNQWPWLGLDRTAIRHPKRSIMAIWQGLPSISHLKDFAILVDVNAMLDQKRVALDLHKSQMTRLNGDEHWETLSDNADGRFLPLLFQPYEMFRRYSLPDDDR